MVLLQLGHANWFLAVYHQLHWSVLFHRFSRYFFQHRLLQLMRCKY